MMNKKLLALIPLILFLVGVAAAQVPYDRNQDQSQDPTSFSTLAIGNILDASMGTPKRLGVPTTPIVTQFFDAPEASDDDHFATTAIFSAAVCAATGDKTALLTAKWNDTNSATGRPFCRNFIVTPSGTTTGTLELVVWDAQGKEYTARATWTNSSTAWTTSFTGRGIKSVNVISAFTSSRTLKIGNGLKFGCDYPMYSSACGLVGMFDTDGSGFPNSADTETWVAGSPAANYGATATADTPGSEAALDRYGTVAFSNNPDGANDYYVIYACTLWNIPEPGNYYPTSSWDLR